MTQQSSSTRAAFIMVCGMVAFTINDSIMKAVLGHIPLMQAIFLRGLVNVVLVSTIVVRLLGAPRFNLSTRDWVLVLARAACETSAAFAFLYAVTRMSFANAVAIEQMVPLVIVLAGFVVFRDPLGWRRSVAVLLGFLGALLIVKPGTGDFNGASVWAFVTVFFITGRDMCVRAMSDQVPTATIAITTVLFVTGCAGAASMAVTWVPMTMPLVFGIVAAGAFLIIGYVCSIVVMRVGDMTATAPFRYTSVVTALILGQVFFDEWPDAWSLLGAAIIAGTGIFTVFREAQLGRRRPRT
ncbi:MAG: DMT family transporter [Celeribacter marinus]